jgi:hypothetical protein
MSLMRSCEKRDNGMKSCQSVLQTLESIWLLSDFCKANVLPIVCILNLWVMLPQLLMHVAHALLLENE